MSTLINGTVKPFNANAYNNVEFVPFISDDLKSIWAIEFFYPLDYTFVCSTDLADFYPKLQDMSVEIYSVSTDTHSTYKAWHDISNTIKKINYPMIATPTRAICHNFEEVIEEECLALRDTFVINPIGKIKVSEAHDLSIVRSAKELVCKIQAAQYTGKVCPASWQPGEATLALSLDLVGKI